MTEQTKTRIPAPIYAAAGAGELAYEQLRKLPEVINELRGKATVGGEDLRQRAATAREELREKATATLKAANKNVDELRGKATHELDREHLREVARRNANTLLAEAKAAQARAIEMYHELVARGERVVGSGVVEAADTVNADIEATEAEAIAAGESPVVESAKAKSESAKTEPTKTAAKRTRPAATRK